MKNKIVIVGCGNVGMSYAFALINQSIQVNEIVLIDKFSEKAVGEAMDLNHGIPFGPSNIKVSAGDYSDCHDAKIVCICAGANQDKGETRLDLVHKNTIVFKEVVSNVVDSGFNGIFLIATNPVDIMTYVTWKHSKFEPNKVIGTGTTLDTARLRYNIANKLNINAKNIHAYVIGEHGDSEFVPWSNANVGLQNINDFLNEPELNNICETVKNSAYEIINRKGNTSYGIGMCLVKITNSILGDENNILTVSSYDKENDIFIGLPSIIDKDGAERKIYLKLTEQEEHKLQNSIDILKNIIKDISL